MDYLAVDKDGAENVFDRRPMRSGDIWVLNGPKFWKQPLSRGDIARLIGRPLSWEDEPVELNEDSLTPKA